MKYTKLLISILIVFLVAFIGSLFTEIGPWYDSIKPSITPPGWVFPVVWNILFLLIALSLYFNWRKGLNFKIKLIYSLNFILNILWSYLFFTLKNVKLAFLDLILLEFSIIYLIFLSYKNNKTSAYLLIPYLLWVGFAGILNYLILKSI